MDEMGEKSNLGRAYRGPIGLGGSDLDSVESDWLEDPTADSDWLDESDWLEGLTADSGWLEELTADSDWLD